MMTPLVDMHTIQVAHNRMNARTMRLTVLLLTLLLTLTSVTGCAYAESAEGVSFSLQNVDTPALEALTDDSSYAYDEFPLERAGVTLHLDRVQLEGTEPDRNILLIHGVTYRLLFGYSIAGTEGAKLYDGLEVVSEHIFDKLVGDALSNRALRSFLKDRGCDTLYLCGLDACGCVAATALGAVKRGIQAYILREGVATVFDEPKITQTTKKLERAGVRYI